MAYDVQVDFSADTAGYASSMQQAIDATTAYTDSLKGVAGVVANTQNLLNRGLVKAFDSVAGANKSAVSQAAAYEQQLSELAGSTVVAAKGSEQLSKQTLKLARDFPIGMRGALDVSKTLTSVGDATASLAEQFVVLGGATGESASQIASLMVPLQRTFGGASKKAVTDFSDALVATTKQFGASATSTLAFSKAIAPLASTVGMSSTQVLGFSTAFARLGEEGFSAANAFNKVMKDFDLAARGGADTLGTYATALGTTEDALKQLYKENPAEVVIQFFEALEKQGPAAISTLEKLGLDGTRSLKALLSVTREGGGLRNVVSEAMGSYGDDTAAKAAQEAFGGFNDSLERLRETTSQTVAQVGKPLAEIASTVVTPMQALAEVINKIAGSELVQFLGKAAFAFGVLRKAIVGLGLAGAVRGAARSGLGASVLGGFLAGRQGIDVLSEGAGGYTTRGSGASTRTAYVTAAATPETEGQRRAARAGQRAGAVFAPGGGLSGIAGRATTGLSNAAAVALNTMAVGTRAAYGNVLADAMVEPGSAMSEAGRRGSRMFRLMDRIQGTSAGRSAEWVTARSDAAEKLAKNLEKASDGAKSFGQRAREGGAALWNYNKAVAAAGPGRAAGQFGRAAAGTVAGGAGLALSMGSQGVGKAASLLTGGLISSGPAAIGLGAAAAVGGAAYYGWKQDEKSKAAVEEAGEDIYGSFNELAEKTGVASEGLKSLSSATEQAVASLKKIAGETGGGTPGVITGKEAVVATQPGYEAALELSEREIALMEPGAGKQEERATQLAASLVARYGGQLEGEMLQQVELDLVNQIGREDAGAVAAEIVRLQEVPEGEMTGPMSEVLSGVISQAEEQLTAGGFRDRSQARDTLQGLAEYIGIQSDQALGIYGEKGAAEVRLQGMRELEALLPEAGQLSGDVERYIAEVAGVGEEGLGQAQGLQAMTASLGENAIGMVEAEHGAEAAERFATAMEDGSLTLSEAIAVTSDDFASLSENTNLLGEGIYEATEQQKAMFDLAMEGGQAQAQAVVSLTDQIKAAGATLETMDVEDVYGATERALLEYAQNEYSSGAKYGASAAMASTAMGQGGGGIVGLLRQAGAISDEGNVTYQASLGGIALIQQAQGYAGSNVSTSARLKEKMQLGNEAAQLEGLSGQEFEVQQRLVEEGLAAQDQLEAMMADRIKARYEYDKQYARAVDDAGRQRRYAEEDYERQITYMKEDYQQQRTYAIEDYERQTAYMAEDYRRQTRYAEEDYERQRLYAQQDYRRQRRYATEDFQKQMLREERDWGKQMVRAAEDTAKGMADPFTRMQAEMTWSMRGFLRNIEEQNRHLAEQQANLDRLREMGVSQQAIDMFGLADPARARQLGRLTAGADAQSIAQMNAAAAARQGIGEESYYESESYRRAAEDREQALADTEEDYLQTMERMSEQHNEAMKRMEEQYTTQMERAAEQYATASARAAEQHATAIARMDEQHKKQLARAEEQQITAMARLEEQTTLALNRMEEDMNDSYLEIVGSYEELSEMTADLIAGHPLEYKDNLVDNMDAMFSDTQDELDRFEEELKRSPMGRFILGLLGDGDLVGDDGVVKIKFDGNMTFPHGHPSGGASTGGGGSAGTQGTLAVAGPAGTYATYGHGHMGAYYLQQGSWANRHRGQDIPAPYGTDVRSTFKGQVVHAGWGGSDGGWAGNHVKVLGDHGYMAIYAHLSGSNVRAGQRINRGTYLGDVGSTGRSFGNHLHYEVRRSPYRYLDDVNPLPFMANGGLATRKTRATVGEAGPEAILPLTEHSLTVLGEAIGSHVSFNEARAARVAPHSSSVVTSTTTIDSSTKVMGPVQVVSNDPNDMGRKLARKQRSQAAFSPRRTS